MKLSREASLATVIIYLTKSPRLEELVDGLIKNTAIEYNRIMLEKDTRNGFVKLLSVGSLSELDEYIFNIYRGEFEYVGGILPEEYSRYLHTLLEIYDFEKLLIMYITPKKVPQPTYMYTDILNDPQYMVCYRNPSYRCLLEIYIDRIISIYRRIYRTYLENYVNALKAIAIFTSIRYFMHLKNSQILELAEYNYSEFIKFVSQKLNLSNQLIVHKLHTILENIEKFVGESLDVLEVYEVVYVYDAVKSILYPSYQLVDQLTLYLINRYYEQKMIRYMHPQMSSVRNRYRTR
ncbi:MAG: hypothetical protein N3D82_04380 [Ignisphaera sp.]|nr:hypothetical protein [Ignisphaera sp.]MCX8168245.1 hypothetical protein [Ignisphaera sp.]MDW8084887.1 hypothetical protein [Ignisphaera sp.]